MKISVKDVSREMKSNIILDNINRNLKVEKYMVYADTMVQEKQCCYVLLLD